MHRPEQYAKIDGLMRTSTDEFTEEFSEQLGRMSGRCLDIGTGPGDVTVDFILPKLNPNSTLLCLDISEHMINYAKKMYGNNERLSFMKFDIERPDLPKDLVEQFDHIISNYCIHWCHDHRQALKNIYSLLRPGGTAFVTFLSNFPALLAFMALEAMPKYQPYMKGMYHIIPPYSNVERPRQTVVTLLNEIGFEIEVCTYRPMTWIYETLDSVREFIVAPSPLGIDDMSAELKDQYMKDLMKEFINRGIVFNKNQDKKNDFSLLVKYGVIICCLKKPSTA